MERITVELPDELAWALAQLVKRIGFNDCRSLAVSDEEAWQMLNASEAVRKALAEAGYAPR
jgi:Arc/MetJ-type ribon-helix-helix transcriptional regulator